MYITYNFMRSECLEAISNWKLDPFTQEEHDYLINYFGSKIVFPYGESDIESLIITVLSDMDN